MAAALNATSSAGLSLVGLGAAVDAVLAGRSTDVADVARGRPVGHDSSHNDAFVDPLRDLEAADWENEGRIVVSDTDVTLPPPDEVSVDAPTVERPALLGGDRESSAVVLGWESRT